MMRKAKKLWYIRQGKTEERGTGEKKEKEKGKSDL